MRKVVLKYGLIAGAILSAMLCVGMVFMDRVGFDNGEVIGYTSMVMAFLAVFFGVKSYRDNVRGGEISLGRAFSVGVLITVVASLCYVATWELVYFKLWPDFDEKFAAHQIAKARASGATEAQLAERQKQMAEFSQMYRNPLINSALTFLEPLPVGLLFALVAAGTLQKKRVEEATLAEVSFKPTADPPAHPS